jgi:membrane protein
VRTLTFWLRPAFVLRVVNRFQKVAGFDRAVALASSALTAVIPLAIVMGAMASSLGARDTAARIIARYGLTGGGADAVRTIFAPPSGASTSLGVAGFLFLMLAVLSFTRAVQRLFELTWDLTPLSVRNTVNGVLWAGGLVLYVVLSGLIHAAIGRSRVDLAAVLVVMPLSVVFFVWTGRVLSAQRIRREALVPFGVLAATLTAVYSVGARVYLPHSFSGYATRYGVIGAVFAMISVLFCIMVVLVGSAAAGREIDDELNRIRRGEMPREDEVRRQWHQITDEARSRWQTTRARARRRG